MLSRSAASTKKGQFLPTVCLSGTEQMAMDVLLLDQAIQNSKFDITIRFYTWKGYWLSIGKNQQEVPQNWKELVKRKKINITRRPSGGGAVLHGSGITYSLIWLSPPRKRKEAYLRASQWLIKGFSNLGVRLNFGCEIPHSIEENCFAQSSAADLVDQEGRKIVGSAQFWKKGSLLQHGEILVDPPKDLWHEIFRDTPPKDLPSKIPREGIDKIFKTACQLNWPECSWQNEYLSEEDLKEVVKKSNDYSIVFD